MTRGDHVRDLPAKARTLASAEAWADVAALLNMHRDVIREHAQLVALLGEALVRTGQASEARTWFNEVLPTLGTSEDNASLRRATMLAGAASFQLGALEEAQRAFSETLNLAAADKDQALVARAMNNLGLIANIQGKWGQAISWYKVAISAHQRLGDTRGLAESYHNMAITYRDQRHLDEADELEKRSVEFATDAKLPLYVSLARLGRAELALLRGDTMLAEASARRVAEEFRIIGDPVREADAIRLAGASCTAGGQFDEARHLLDSALERTRQLGSVLNEAETLKARSELFLAIGSRAEAVDDARAALSLFRQLGANKDAATMLRWLGEMSFGES